MDFLQRPEKVIGDDFGIICEYLDNKRDRDTLKAILTKLTSSTFMVKLANVQDKHTFQCGKDQVDMNIQVFKESVEWKGESWKKEIQTSSEDETRKASSCI
ncbi:Hypothetical predicted protein [Paramuricea clavata]|uniref:Uncharacterized protein n=1 Tax=Paramuricea clavata TaxID=317549 RepID=A0A6S7K7J1_PARCT|nr:Hypothetical predicted protein [Paramuricea clavata]